MRSLIETKFVILCNQTPATCISGASSRSSGSAFWKNGMIRPCFKIALTMLTGVCVWVLCAADANAQNRGKTAGTAPERSKPAKKVADQSMESNSDDNSSRSKDDAGLAGNNSPNTKPGSNETVKKKSDRKGAKDSKRAAKKPSGRSRGADVTGPQVLVGDDLNLEPET